MYSQTEGSVFCSVIAVGSTTAASAVYGITAPTRSDGGVAATFGGLNYTSNVYAAGLTNQTSFVNSASRNTLHKHATAFRTNDFANSYNGNIATDASGTLVSIMDRFVIGANGNTGSPSIGNNIIASLNYYRRRLPNPKLQALTA
jgi:hypothetical protein